MTSVWLSDRSLVAVTGSDARQLMHNVLTVSMDRVDHGGLAYGGLLTPQGKIICDFIVHKAEGEVYYVDIRTEAADDFIRRMTLYRLRADVEITRLDPGPVVLANWAGDAPSGASRDPRLNALGYRYIASSREQASETDLAAYHSHRIALTVPEGGLDFGFSETFPHDAGMDQLGGIDFAKGCYVGQEVISRMAHRGTARRRVMAVKATENGPGTLGEVGADLLADSRSIGRLGTSQNGKGIAIVRLDRLHKAVRAGAKITIAGQPVDVEVPAWADYSLNQFAA